jgi:lysophospholipase L1-like esterase
MIRWLIRLLNSGTLSRAQNGVLLIAPQNYVDFFENASTILLSYHLVDARIVLTPSHNLLDYRRFIRKLYNSGKNAMPAESPSPTGFSLKNLLLNAAMAIITSTLFLLLIEAGLRLFWKNPAHYAGATSESLFWQYDSLLGWSMQPNAQGRFIRPEFVADIKTNSLGLRDDEIAPQKTPNEIRLLLIGDSVTAGFEVARSETYEAQLEARLNNLHDGKIYQVINAGFRGYGTDQELLFLQSRGLALASDVVVMAFVPINDLQDNVTVHAAGRLYAKPFFEYAADSSLILRGVPVPQYSISRQIYTAVVRQPGSTEDVAPPESWRSALKKVVSENFLLYGFIAQRLKNADPRLVAFLKKSGILQQTPLGSLDFYRTPLPEDWQRRWRVTLDLLLRVKKLCDAHQIRLLVWLFPLKEMVYQDDRKILIETHEAREAIYDFIEPERKLAEFCRDNNILFVSPLARIRKEAGQGRRFHFKTDNHFNAAGHALLAEELFAFLLEHRLLEKQSPIP